MKYCRMMVLMLAVAASAPALGQGMVDGKRLDTLMARGQYATAYQLAREHYQRAQYQYRQPRLTQAQERRGAELLEAAFYLTALDYAYCKSPDDSALARYGMLARQLQGTDRAVAYSFLYQTYSRLYSNRYIRLRNNKVSDDPHLGYARWHLQRMEDTLRTCADSALANARGDGSLLDSLVQTLLAQPGRPPRVNLYKLTDAQRSLLVLPLPEFDRGLQADSTLPWPLGLHQRVARLYASAPAEKRLWLDLRRYECCRYAPELLAGIEGLERHYDTLPVPDELRALLRMTKARYLSYDRRKVEAEQLCLAIERDYPDSYGARCCRALRDDICRPWYEIRYNRSGATSRSRMAMVEATNVEWLDLRLVNYIYLPDSVLRDHPDTLLSLPAAQVWRQALPDPGDHLSHQYLVALPPVPQGDYYLVASTDSSFCYDRYQSVDAAFIAYDMPPAAGKNTSLRPSSGHLVDRTTGQPLAGRQVTLTMEGSVSYRDYHRRCRTDKEGFFHFPTSSARYWLMEAEDITAQLDGYDYHYADAERWHSVVSSLMAERRKGKMLDLVMTDRPVYRLGDTVRFCCVAYKQKERGAAWDMTLKPAAGVKLVATFGVSYGDTEDTLLLRTDKHGRCWGEFVVHADGRNGTYVLEVQSPNADRSWHESYYECRTVEVEAYKPPHFMVSLSTTAGDADGDTGSVRRFGQPITVYGTAQSYSGAPMTGARVKWEVSRERLLSPLQSTSVASEYPYYDSLTVGDDGLFQFSFTPAMDSGTVIYTAHVRVTDADGELHEQVLSFRVSDRDGYCLLAGDDLSHLTFVYNNFDHQPLPGAVHVELYQLRQPDTLRTLDPLMEQFPEAQWLGTREEFYRAFPYRAYSREEGDPRQWPVVAKRYETTTERRQLDIDGLPSGLYRLCFTAPDGGRHDTVVSHVAPGGRVTGSDMVWVRTTPRRDLNYYPSLNCQVGDTVRFELGSPYGNQPLYYCISHAAKVYRRGMLVLDSSHTTTLAIPITSKMAEGCRVVLTAMREGIVFQTTYAVVVARPDRFLTVSTETFRDRLQPGEREQWRLRIATADTLGGKPAKGVVANLCLTMYDQSLEQYEHHRYGFWPWYRGHYRNDILPHTVPHTYPYFESLTGSWRFSRPNYIERSAPAFGSALPDVSVYYQQVALSLGKNLEEIEIASERVPIIEIGTPESGQRLSSDDIQRMPGNSVNSVVAAVGGIGYSDGGESGMVTMQAGVRKRTGVNVPKEAIAEILPTFNFGDNTEENAPSLRQNMSTLALYEPALRSDKEGRVEVEFQMPDALTQWRLHGFAWTDRFQVGTLERTLRTQKELMVQPLLPRFLRQGDTTEIRAKVSNLGDEDMTVEVTMEVEDMERRCPRRHSLECQVVAHSSAVVAFRVPVDDDWHVAEYKIVARNLSATQGHLSDGEQGRLPVLSNRERITESRLLYVSGTTDSTTPKTAHYEFSILNSQLSISFTSNPMEYAIQALPHFERHRMPGSLYLANSIYVSHLSSQLSPLSDKERKRLESRAKSDLHDLLQGQTSEGGWSWMPKGKTPSLHITEAILQRLATCPSLADALYYRRYYLQAIAWLDKELVKQYQIENGKLKIRLEQQIILNSQLSTLYTRSFYLDVKPLEKCDSLTRVAYEYYYQRCKEQALVLHSPRSALHSQGQLALLLLRMGDSAEAVAVANRIKESAHTDEQQGMYWVRNVSGYGWYQRPVETAALMVDVFADVLHDWESVNRIQQWLLTQKQATAWKTDMATAHAVAALVRQPWSAGVPAGKAQRASLTVNGQPYEEFERDNAGETPALQTTLNFQLENSSPYPAWGAVFMSRELPLDSIPCNGTGISLRKTLSLVGADGSLHLLDSTATLHVGDRVRVHIDIHCERDMDNMVLSDQRAAAFEPVSTASGWQWSDGLNYYVDVRDERVDCYVDRLREGRYYVEYDVWVRHAGTFASGIGTLRSVYAPEFRANTPSSRLRVALDR